ncbi:hypothetical protein G7070_08390 [Propioniciclava coleopterorum]|uniref:Uncharacterized protein n=1 Tax=Propioniciclava coleopterorum TaxID=2714937 RepID=A0A6G7Y674_9ACTN|nr:hypothetical protein [Propioniciclava coleopterorum]QIK72283.1 hypothetical protein G7070_08390 [Propioniciclava coleopterorum]
MWPLVAAAAAGLLLGALVTWVALVPGGLAAPPPASPNPRPASALVTGTGERVGSVDRTALESGDVLVITVQARPGASYECVLVIGDGSRVSGGVWTLGDYGPGSAIWVVPTGGATVRGVELVAPSGTVWSRAEL